MTDHSAPHGHMAADWDARYSEESRIWSGNPNQALVAEVTGLTPGTALDVGCGEGADAIWLAQQGWQVTALDPSSVALERARAAAESAGVTIDFRHTGLTRMSQSFDLVSAFYPALPKVDDAMTDLLDAVAPGGTLLMVHHVEFDRDRALEHGFDPDDFVSVDEVAAAMESASWQIVEHAVRNRDVREGAGAHHTQDLVLRATRSRS
ncbi:class I SAM-dependent methyltransferase [Rudaeicoccus suwonensis]|nr:methyltransferase domain-containing protein [Rudaeicoccus suwonensis]